MKPIEKKAEEQHPPADVVGFVKVPRELMLGEGVKPTGLPGEAIGVTFEDDDVYILVRLGPNGNAVMDQARKVFVSMPQQLSFTNPIQQAAFDRWVDTMCRVFGIGRKKSNLIVP